MGAVSSTECRELLDDVIVATKEIRREWGQVWISPGVARQPPILRASELMFELSYNLTSEDFRHFIGFYAKRLRGQMPVSLNWATDKHRWAAIVICVGLVMSFVAILLSARYSWLDPDTANYIALSLLAGFLTACVLFLIVLTGATTNYVRSNGPLTGPAQLTASDAGISIRLPSMKMEFAWAAFMSVSSDEGYIALWLEPCLAEFIPDRAFSSPEQRAAFLEFVSVRLPLNQT